MSLQVWLPLNGKVKNQGLYPFVPVNTGAKKSSGGKIGECFEFDGVDDAIKIPFNNIITSDFTIAFWFYKSDWGSKNYETLFGGPSGFEIEAKYSYTNSPVVVGWNWGVTKPQMEYTLGTWNHVVMTRNSTETKWYLNGELKATGISGDIPGGDYFIGAWRTSSEQNFYGKINDFRIYDNVLSIQEIKELAKGLVLHYTFENTPSTALSAIKSDGTQYIDLEWATTTGMTCKYKASWQGGNTSYVVGSHDSNENKFGRNGGYLDYNRNFWELGYGNNYPQENEYERVLDKVYEVEFSTISGKAYLKVDGKQIITDTSTQNTASSNVFLFSHQYAISTAPGNYTTATVYYCKIYDSTGKLKFDLVPICYNGYGAFLDRVSNKIFESKVGNPLTFIPSTTVTDSSGYGYHGTLNKLKYYTASKNSIRGTYSLHSIGDATASISTPLNPSFITNGTIVIWYKKDSSAFDYNGGNFLMATPTGGGGIWLCATRTNDKPFNNDATPEITAWYVDGISSSNSNYQDTEWHMYAATGIDLSSWSSLTFHQHGDVAWLYRGDIADIRIYSTALSADDILELYNTSAYITSNGTIACYGEFIEV